MSHVGSRLLADVADRTALTGELAEALDELRRPGTRHDPGRVLVDLAVAVADGARTDRERTAIAAVPKKVWSDAVDADGGHRDGAGIAEITGLLPAAALEGYPSGTRGDRPP